LEEAIRLLREARETSSAFQFEEIGLCLWLLNRPVEACEDWNLEMERFRRHETQYSEVGSILVPSLLWWASAHRDIPEATQYRSSTIKDIKWRRGLKFVQRHAWSACCADFLLDRRSHDELIAAACTDNDLVRNMEMQRSYFFLAAKALDAGDISKYLAILEQSLAYDHDVLQPELFLARFEIARIKAQRRDS
jgi:hypothetical protein